MDQIGDPEPEKKVVLVATKVDFLSCFSIIIFNADFSSSSSCEIHSAHESLMVPLPKEFQQ